MNKKRRNRILFGVGSIALLTLSSAFVAVSNGSSLNVIGIQNECTNHSGYHYAAKAPTLESSGWSEYWICCSCHEVFLSQPEGGSWIEGTEAGMVGGAPSVGHDAYLPKLVAKINFDYTSANFDYYSGKDVVFTGDFSEDLTITSVKQDAKHDNGGFEGWEFVQKDTEKEYKDYVTFVDGDNGSLTFSKELCALSYTAQDYIVTFSSGDVVTLTVNSNVEMFSDYDSTTMMGYINGNYNPGSPLNSGMWGAGTIIEKGVYAPNENGLIISSTQNSADLCAFTTRLHSHPWDWYTINGQENKMYRTTFTYRLTNFEQGEVYFFIMVGGDETFTRNNVYGDFDSLDWVAGDNYYKVRYNLIADGELHEFDSGFYMYNSLLRNTKIQLPSFTEADDKEVVIDNYRVVSKVQDTITVDEFDKNNPQNLVFKTPDSLSKLLIDDVEKEFIQTGDEVTLDKEILSALSFGDHTIKLEYADYLVFHTLTVMDSRAAELTETNKNVIFGESTDVKLAGNFDSTLSVVSFKRKNNHDWDNTSDNQLNAIKGDGSLKPTDAVLSSDGLTVKRAVVDQAYGVTGYTVTLSNGKVVNFTLTSNNVFYSNFNETHVFIDNVGGNQPCTQDLAMCSFPTVSERRVLRYTPSDAVLGHALGADNRLLTFSVNGRNTWWWNDWLFDADLAGKETVYIHIEYEITGSCDDFVLGWWNSSDAAQTIALSNTKTVADIELDASNLNAFGIGCNAYGAASAGSYMDIKVFAFGVK